MKFLFTNLVFLFAAIQFCIAQTGVGTLDPKATLDVNGDIIVRKVPLLGHNGDHSFSQIGIDNENRIIIKNEDINSYSIYLGFDPMASLHAVKTPIKLENGYITRLTGTSIGACYGVNIDFEIKFIDKTLVSAVLQGYPMVKSLENTVYDRVVLTRKSNIFGTALENLAKATTCGSGSGHVLSLSAEGFITVTFSDRPTYYKNAGIFIVYSVEKEKYY